MTTRKRYSDRMAATLKAWSAQIADRQANGRKVADLQQQRTEYAQQMWKTRDTRAAVFRDMRQGAERMAAEFRKTYMQATSRFAS